MGIIFIVLYIGSRYQIQWIIGSILLPVGYLASIEYVQLMKRLDVPLAAPEFLLWVPVLTLSFILFDGRYAEVTLMFAIAYQMLRYLRETPHRVGLNQAAAGVLGLLYIPWLLHYFYLIYLGGVGQPPHVGAVHALVVLLMVWGYDAGAYFIGKFFGRHQAFPNVSPKKTWEGVAGGFVLALGGGMVGFLFALLARSCLLGCLLSPAHCGISRWLGGSAGRFVRIKTEAGGRRERLRHVPSRAWRSHRSH